MNRILKISCALLPGLLAAGCSFEEPQAPSFETNIYIPLGTERATGLDLLEEENISGDSTGVEPLQFSMKGGLDRFEAAALLDLTLSPAHFSSTISDIGIEPPEEIRIDYTLGDLSGLSLPPGGTHLIVEPFTFSPVRTELSDQETFEWIRLAQGRIDIQITNDLAVPVGGGSGDPVSLSLSLWNRDVEEKAFEVSLVGGLAPAQTATWSVDLSGIDLRDRLDIEFGGGSSGSGGDPVWVEAAQSLGISLLFHDLEPDSVIAAVGPQYAAVTGGVALPGDIRIDEGEIQEGLIHLQVQNELPLQAYADLTFPELWNERGDNITQRIALPSSQSGPDGPAEVTIDLAGAIWGSASGAVGDTLHYQLDIETMGSYGVSASLGRRQAVVAEIDQTTVSFRWIRGSADNREIEIESSETEIDPPEGIAELDFLKADLMIDILSSVGLTAATHLVLEALDLSGATLAILPLEMTVLPGNLSNPGRSTLVLNETNSDVLEIIRSRPDRLRVGGSLLVGQPGESATISREDWVEGSYTLVAPLRVIVGQVRHTADPYSITLSDEEQDRILQDLPAAVIEGTVENHLPVGITARFIFADQEEALEIQPGLELESIEVDSGQFDSSTGRVIEAVISSFRIELDQNDIAFFAKDEVWGLIEVVLKGDGLTPVEFTATDYVEVKGILSMRMRVES